MGAQDLALAMRVGLKKEGVVHVARRMPWREVELGEIVVVALDVRPFGDGEAHVGEDGDDLVHHLAQGVDAAGLDARQADGQGHVLGLALELRLERDFPEDRAPRRERLRHLVFQRIDRRAVRPALVGRELAKRRQQRRDRALLAQRRDAHRLERGFVACGFDRGERLVLHGDEIGHSRANGKEGVDPFSRSAGEGGAWASSDARLSTALAPDEGLRIGRGLLL